MLDKLTTEEKEFSNTFQPIEIPEKKERRYLPTLSELLDRLSIVQLKEAFIPEHKEEYAKEIKDIIYDIDIILKENNINISAKILRAIIVVAQANTHIWYNESRARQGDRKGNDLLYTHTINGVRARGKDKIQELINGRKDFKFDCLAAEFSQWEPSWNDD